MQLRPGRHPRPSPPTRLRRSLPALFPCHHHSHLHRNQLKRKEPGSPSSDAEHELEVEEALDDDADAEAEADVELDADDADGKHLTKPNSATSTSAADVVIDVDADAGADVDQGDSSSSTPTPTPGSPTSKPTATKNGATNAALPEEYKNGYVTCQVCSLNIDIRDPKTGKFTVQMWEEHKERWYVLSSPSASNLD